MMPHPDTVKPDHDLLIELKTQMEEVKRTIDAILEKLDKKYVTQDEFLPVKNLVYGFASLTLVSVVSAILYLVIKH